MSNEKGSRCTIGDDFTGVKKIIHDMLMNNELYGGYGAYKVSYANTGDPENKSGLSFGVNQMDMSNNLKGRKLFKDILKNAEDKNGKLILSTKEIATICGSNDINLMQTLKTPEQVFDKSLRLINAALSSEYGVKKINDTYLDALNKDMTHVDKAINLMNNPAAKAFYDNDAGRTWLYDFHNQYGLTLKGDEAKFINDYINGDYNGTKRFDFSSKEKYAAPTDHYGLEDHVKFLHSTEQYSKTPLMVDKRIEKTFNLLESYGLNQISVVKNTGVESFESCHLGDKYVPLDGDLWIQTRGDYYDPIKTNIMMQSLEDTDAQLDFLNLDSSYYPASNTNNLSYETSPTPLNNIFFEPYVPSYTLIDFSTPSTYIEPYNFSIDNYNSNINYFDITNYQIPVDSNFGLGNYNWGGGGYFGGGYGGGSNYFGNNYFFSMQSKQSALDAQFSSNNALKSKPYVLNDIIDLESSSDHSLNILLEVPTLNTINDSNREYLDSAQDTMIQDPLRDFFELSALIA